MKFKQILEKITTPIGQVQSHHEGFDVLYTPTRGYYAIGTGAFRNKLRLRFFDHADEAIEHAELETT